MKIIPKYLKGNLLYAYKNKDGNYIFDNNEDVLALSTYMFENGLYINSADRDSRGWAGVKDGDGIIHYVSPTIENKLKSIDPSLVMEELPRVVVTSYLARDEQGKILRNSDGTPISFDSAEEREKYYTRRRLDHYVRTMKNATKYLDENNPDWRKTYGTTPDMKTLNTVTGGALNWLSPTQVLGNATNLVKLGTGNMDLDEFGRSLVEGNYGVGEVFGRDWAQEHPGWNLFFNMLGDGLILSGTPNKVSGYSKETFKRGIESGMRISEQNSIIGNLKNPSVNLLDRPTWKYIFTGKYPKVAGESGRKYKPSFHKDSGQSSYAGFDTHKNNEKFIFNPERKDIIDAGIHGELVDHPDLKYVHTYDYGPHNSYIRKNYPNRNIQVYEIPQGEFTVPENEIENIKDISSWEGKKYSQMASDNLISAKTYNPVDVGGYMKQRGVLNGRIVERTQDIYKFNPKEYTDKYSIKSKIENAILKLVDKNFDPIITRTKWRYVE